MRTPDGTSATQAARFRDGRGYWSHIMADVCANLCHFAGALWGVGLKFEPTGQVSAWKVGLSFVLWLNLALWAVLSWNTGVLLGLCFFWLSPLWAQAVARLADPVLEYRSYLAVAGWGLILAELLPPWAVAGLCGFWFMRSWNRSHYLKDRVTYWGQAVKENPNLPEQRAHNYGMCLYLESQRLNGDETPEGARFEDAALVEFNRVLTVRPDCERVEFYRTSLLAGREHRALVRQGGVIQRFRLGDKSGLTVSGLLEAMRNTDKREPNELLLSTKPLPQTEAAPDRVSR